MSGVSQPHVASRLRQLVYSSPAETALFFARLWTCLVEQDDEVAHEALHALALAFLATDQPYSALHLVKDSAEGPATPPQTQGDSRAALGCGQCAIIVARCCEKVGRYSEGQAVLHNAVQRGASLVLPQMSALEGSVSPSLLLARMSHKGKSRDVAVEHYTKALAEDPWLWEAFVGLCDIGEPPAAEQLFPDPPAKARPTSHPRSPRTGPAMPTLPMPRSSASEDPALAPRKRQSPHSAAFASHGLFTPDAGSSANGGGMNGAAVPSRLGMMGYAGAGASSSASASAWETPSFGGSTADTTFPGMTPTGGAQLPIMPQPSRRPFPGLMSALSSASSAMIPASLRSSQSQVSSGSSTAVTTPVTAPVDGTSAVVAKAPPAMKRPRAQMSRRGDSAPSNAMRGLEIRPGGREMRGIEPNGETPSDGIVRRSTRLKTGPTAKLPRHQQQQSQQQQQQDQRSVRSRSATSSSSVMTTAGGTSVGTSQSPGLEAAIQAAADDWLRNIVRRCARAYRALSMYRCAEAIRELRALPNAVKHSAWATDISARALYEMANYSAARAEFQVLFEMEPYRLKSSELYSTTLYLLCDAPTLSHLTQTLMAVDRTTSPQAWMSSGNVFSLLKDHDEAMRCFKRATQVDPECAYAWTLCGYEASEMDEYERAMGYFRNAIRTDARHYNAWYGMGLVYLKQGKPKHAEHHFRRASEINPTNPILLCCIGQVLEQQGQQGSALQVYEQAVKYSDKAPMVVFKYARLLVAQRRIEEAIPRLQALSRTAPEEAQVQFLLGKCHVRKNRRAEAAICFAYARELQPKLEHAIRKVLSVVGDLDNDDDDDDDDDDDENEDEDDAM